MSSDNNLMNVYNKETIDSLLLEKLGFNETNISRFNFAQITKTLDGVEHIEYWIMSNARYDQEHDRFVKTDLYNPSFGIQIQAKGTYPGEAALGYNDIMGVNIWRCPTWLNSNDEWIVFMDSTTYDYTDVQDSSKHYIGAKHRSSDEWREFAIATGWNNNLMTDSFGGVTIGGAGFEIDGNGIFPYTRLTSSVGYVNGDKYYMLGLLDNAYHGSLTNWDCDDNKHQSWFVGLISPPKMNGSSEVYLTKDLANAKFVVMYNDTPENQSDIHDMNTNKWHIIFESNKTSVKGMVSGVLTTLGSGGGGGSSVTVVDNLTSDSSTDALSAKMGKKLNTEKLAIAQGSSNASKNVVTDSSGNITVEAKPTIPTAGSSTPSADVSGGAVGSSSNYAKADHQHPLSTAYATASHSHSFSDLPTANAISNGDTTHVVSADVIYDYIETVIGDANTWLTS